MALPGLNIQLLNGGLGRFGQIADDVAGLLLTGTAEGELKLNTVEHITSAKWLQDNEVTEAKNPLVYKEVTQFYQKAAEGSELYLMVVEEGKKLSEMVAAANLEKLLDGARGRIRLLGINNVAAYDTSHEDDGLDADVMAALTILNKTANDYAAKISPFRAFLPAIMLDPTHTNLFEPRSESCDRVGIVAAADQIFTVGANKYPSAAIGQVLGMAASIPVHQSIARVRNGAASLTGWLMNGQSIDEAQGRLADLDAAGYIVYRTYVGKNGYYFNDDPMAASASDNDYSNLNLGRVIDKAIVLAYNAYINEILDSIEVDANGYIPRSLCIYYQNLLNRAILYNMNGEVSSFETYIDPNQNILSTSTMNVTCLIVPKGTLRTININLGFTNPAITEE